MLEPAIEVRVDPIVLRVRADEADVIQTTNRYPT